VSGQSWNPSDRYLDAWKKYLDAACPLEPDSIRHFVYFARDRELIHNHPFLTIQRFVGAQIMYPWAQLEPEKGAYDFSMVMEDYSYLKLHDRGATQQYDDNGKVSGWVALRWNPKVQERFALLLKALGKEFDGKVEGINLQESAIGVESKTDTTFTPARYTESLKINMLTLKKAFPESTTMQYANFMPGEWLPNDDKGYLRSVFQYGQEIGVGLGGPDLMFRRKGQLNHILALMHEGKFTVPMGIAVQDGNYIGETGDGRIVIVRENMVPLLHAFARDFLKVKFMFWVCQEPYFSEDVIPCFVSE
jgi:hypothetical protein